MNKLERHYYFDSKKSPITFGDIGRLDILK